MKFAEKLKKAMQELNLNQRQVVTMTGKSKGCFLGKIDKFLEKVTQTHGNNKYALVYRAAVEVAKLQIELTERK